MQDALPADNSTMLFSTPTKSMLVTTGPGNAGVCNYGFDKVKSFISVMYSTTVRSSPFRGYTQQHYSQVGLPSSSTRAVTVYNQCCCCVEIARFVHVYRSGHDHALSPQSSAFPHFVILDLHDHGQDANFPQLIASPARRAARVKLNLRLLDIVSLV